MRHRFSAAAVWVVVGVLTGCSLGGGRALEQSAQAVAAERWADAIPLCKRVLLKDPSRSMARYYLGLSYLHTDSPALARGELELFLADIESGKAIEVPGTAAGAGEPRQLLRARALAGAGAANVLIGLMETFSENPDRRQAAEYFRTGRELCERAYRLAPADRQVLQIIDKYVTRFGVMSIPRLQHAGWRIDNRPKPSRQDA